MKFQFFRRFFYEIHLWLGIVSGVILFIVCLSGTIFVFQEEAQRIAEPGRYYVDVPQNVSAKPIDDLIAEIEKERPNMVVSSVTIPEKSNRTISMSLSPKPVEGEENGHDAAVAGGPRDARGQLGAGAASGAEGRRTGRGRPVDGENRREGTTPSRERPAREGGNREGGNQGGARPNMAAAGQGRPGGQGSAPNAGHGGGRGRNVLHINPYTGAIVGEGANVVDPFFMSMMQLHRFLWLTGEWRWYGKMIVGVTTLLFVVICLSGVVLWLPRTWSSFTKWRAWKLGFRIRFRKGVWPLMYDLHNSVGFYLLIPALLLALTGLCWSFTWYRNATSYVLGDQVFKQRMQRPEAIEPIGDSSKPFSVGEMIARQNELVPGPGEISVTIPQDNATAMVIQKGRTGFFALAMKDKTQWDRFRGMVVPVEHHGQIVEVERFADKPFGAKIAASVRAVHFGNITGLSSKIFFFIVCLFVTSFPVTGVALWAKKLRAKHKKRQMQKNATVTHDTPSV